MLTIAYAECHVTYKPLMLSVHVLNVVRQSVVMVNVAAPNAGLSQETMDEETKGFN